MEEEVDEVLEALSEVNSQNVSGGIESTTALSSQVSTLVGQGKNIMTLMGEDKINN
ncbi:MAG: hypothetical protein GWN86_04560, partial [Desulfobacterales bacterium]|nr:hypothetical protein [Desulfobacterales bacterium]